MTPLIFVGLVGVLCLISGASWKAQAPTGLVSFLYLAALPCSQSPVAFPTIFAKNVPLTLERTALSPELYLGSGEEMKDDRKFRSEAFSMSRGYFLGFSQSALFLGARN